MSSQDNQENVPEARKTGVLPTHRKTRFPLKKHPEQAAKRFFESSNFAVAGASAETHKFGYKILEWYHQHSLPVTAMNPKQPTITISSANYQAVASPSALQDPESTSLSVVCPPPVTKTLLKEAKEAGIKAVWLQPGTYDDEVLQYAHEEFEAGVGGMEGGTVGAEGWCVLVDGEKALRDAGRKWEARI